MGMVLTCAVGPTNIKSVLPQKMSCSNLIDTEMLNRSTQEHHGEHPHACDANSMYIVYCMAACSL